VDHSSVTALAPAPSTAVKVIVRTARLEAHVGLTVAAVAAALGAAVGESKNGAMSVQIKTIGAETTVALLKLYFLTAGKIDFDRVARERGVEVLVENDIPPEAAKSLVNEAMKLLKRIVGDQLN
jgi:hypothetical protein